MTAPPSAAGRAAGGGDTLRLDKWLWHARFFKSRTLASAFCEAAGVRIAGQPVRKAHYPLRVGDVMTFRHGPHIRILKVVALSARRLSPALARDLYEDLAPPPPRGERPPDPPDPPASGARAPGSGRPTKAEGRAIARLKGAD